MINPVLKKKLTDFTNRKFDSIIKNFFFDEKNKVLLSFFSDFKKAVLSGLLDIARKKKLDEISTIRDLNLNSERATMSKHFPKYMDKYKGRLSPSDNSKILKFKRAFIEEISNDKELSAIDSRSTNEALAEHLESLSYIEGEDADKLGVKGDIEYLRSRIYRDTEKAKNEDNRFSNSSFLTWNDASKLEGLIDAISNRRFSPRPSDILKIFRGEKKSFKINQEWLKHFVWLLNELYRLHCFKISPKKGHFTHFENLIDRNYLNSNSKVSFKIIASKIRRSKTPNHPIKSMISGILIEAKILNKNTEEK